MWTILVSLVLPLPMLPVQLQKHQRLVLSLQERLQEQLRQRLVLQEQLQPVLDQQPVQ